MGGGKGIIVEYWGRESFSLLLGRVLTLSINSLLLPLSISISASHLCFVGTIDTNCITVIPSPSESSNTNTTESSSSNTPPSTPRAPNHHPMQTRSKSGIHLPRINPSLLLTHCAQSKLAFSHATRL